VSCVFFVFFLNCVHIAYFSTSFGSHSHSLSTNILSEPFLSD
jgi:hypothetical protein